MIKLHNLQITIAQMPRLTQLAANAENLVPNGAQILKVTKEKEKAKAPKKVNQVGKVGAKERLDKKNKEKKQGRDARGKKQSQGSHHIDLKV